MLVCGYRADEGSREGRMDGGYVARSGDARDDLLRIVMSLLRTKRELMVKRYLARCVCVWEKTKLCLVAGSAERKARS